MIPGYQTLRRLYRYWRVRSSPLRGLPRFIIVGAQKGGTSTLFQLLARHPQVRPGRLKEVHYFDYRYHRGEAWYRAQFPLGPGRGKITGEASPYYLYHPLAPERIRKLVPRVKLIALLRNPIDRAYSHYHHSRRLGRESLSFEEAIRREAHRLEGEHDRMVEDPSYHSFAHQNFSYLERGHYHEQLQRYLKHFSRSQLLVLKSEELFESPRAIWDRVLDFLGLARTRIEQRRAWNAGRYDDLDGELRAELAEYFRPWNRRLVADWGSEFDWSDS